MKEQTRRGNPREAIQDPPGGIYVVSLRCPEGWFFNAPWCPGSGYIHSALVLIMFHSEGSERGDSEVKSCIHTGRCLNIGRYGKTKFATRSGLSGT